MIAQRVEEWYYELAYTIERIDGELVVVVMAGTRENFYDELKRYIKR